MTSDQAAALPWNIAVDCLWLIGPVAVWLLGFSILRDLRS